MDSEVAAPGVFVLRSKVNPDIVMAVKDGQVVLQWLNLDDPMQQWTRAGGDQNFTLHNAGAYGDVGVLTVAPFVRRTSKRKNYWVRFENDVRQEMEMRRSMWNRQDYLCWFMDLSITSLPIRDGDPSLKKNVFPEHWRRQLSTPTWSISSDHEMVAAVDFYLSHLLSKGLSMLEDLNTTEKIVRYYLSRDCTWDTSKVTTADTLSFGRPIWLCRQRRSWPKLTSWNRGSADSERMARHRRKPWGIFIAHRETRS